ncbi:trigger factor [Marinococcus halophilus]|uniref:Trigger factor n=1 Tax=Marinococcus halophilus TaxID=1371 RepID=A0A510Y4G6_MARHA|nr:trigger factor [Marinococcus halophilus]OZT80006.1 trigger factor [Marinococcus halophilus]GEK58073.1 trigger factor [Marinococcus halophilus]
MNASWEKKEGNQGVLTVDVESERFDKALDQAFNKVKNDVSIPGFRKGKVPRKLFESRFGVESLYQDALDILLPDVYAEAVDEAGIEPVDRPEIDVEEVEKGKDLKFTATVTVKPEVELGEIKGLEVEEFDTSVSDEEVNEELENLQSKYADLAVVEEGEVQDGDTAVLDFEGFVDGEAFEGGSAENHSLEIGSDSFIPGFEEQVVGMQPGTEKDITVTFPEEYHAENLAGQEAVFHVKLHEIKRKELPELDDEFAKDVEEHEAETLDELKEAVRHQLEHDREHEKEHHERDTVVEQAAEKASAEIPQAMINTESDRMLQEFSQRLQSQGMTLEMYQQVTGTDEEGMKEQFQPEAEKRVRMNLTLEAVAEQENLEASEEDVENELQKMADMYQRDKEEIRSLIEMQGGVDMLKQDLRLQRAIDYLVEHSKTVPKKEKPEAEEAESE